MKFPLSLQSNNESKMLDTRQELAKSLKDIFATTGLFPPTRSLSEIILYFGVAIMVGFGVANAYEHDWILRTAANWPKATNKTPFDLSLQKYSEGIRDFDARSKREVHGDDVYFWNGTNNTVEGHIFIAPEGSGVRYVYLSPACEIFTPPDNWDIAIPIAGPGAIVNLDNTNINHIDIIDNQESVCFLTRERQRKYAAFLGYLASFFK